MVLKDKMVDNMRMLKRSDDKDMGERRKAEEVGDKETQPAL